MGSSVILDAMNGVQAGVDRFFFCSVNNFRWLEVLSLRPVLMEYTKEYANDIG